MLALAALVVAAPASALPRYSSRYAQDCRLCHQNPTGGGLRTLYASQFIVPTELAARAPAIDTIEPLLGNRLLFGLDLRTLFVESENQESTQLQMQSDLHLAVLVDETTSIQIDLGQGGAREAFGLAYLLPTYGWLKVGKFLPNYGWRFADHQLFARRYLLDTSGSDSPRIWESTGMEAGLAPGRFVLTGSLDSGGQLGDSWTTSGVWRTSLSRLDIALGASYLRREEVDGHRRSAGFHGYLHLGPASWLSQWDEPRQGDRRGRIITQELSFVVAQGWTLRFTHGFHDPDRDYQTGIRQRFGGGVDLLATPFFGLLAMVNYDDPEPGLDVADASGWSADLVFHFLY